MIKFTISVLFIFQFCLLLLDSRFVVVLRKKNVRASNIIIKASSREKFIHSPLMFSFFIRKEFTDSLIPHTLISWINPFYLISFHSMSAIKFEILKVNFYFCQFEKQQQQARQKKGHI